MEEAGESPPPTRLCAGFSFPEHVNREQKAEVIEQIAAQISGAEAVYAIDYRGLTVTQAAELRSRLREADASFRIVKNTLSLRAADKAGAEALKPLVEEGPTALTFVAGEGVVHGSGPPDRYGRMRGRTDAGPASDPEARK